MVTGTTHKIYKSAQASNTGNDPTTDDGTWWVEQSATNRWKAFDQKIADQTSNPTWIIYYITPETMVTGLAFFGLDAGSVRVQVYDESATEIYDEERDIVDNTAVVDWFSYFTEDVIYDTEALFVDVPGYSGYEIKIVVNGGTGDAKVGQVVLGKVSELGVSLDGTEIGISDYSTKERDDFGNPVIVERDFAETADFEFAMNNTDARRVQRILAGLRATPAVYFAGEEITYFGATVYGLLQDITIPIRSAGKSIVTLEVEGLV
jgi:hypothetical protein